MCIPLTVYFAVCECIFTSLHEQKHALYRSLQEIHKSCCQRRAMAPEQEMEFLQQTWDWTVYFWVGRLTKGHSSSKNQLWHWYRTCCDDGKKRRRSRIRGAFLWNSPENGGDHICVIYVEKHCDVSNGFVQMSWLTSNKSRKGINTKYRVQ